MEVTFWQLILGTPDVWTLHVNGKKLVATERQDLTSHCGSARTRRALQPKKLRKVLASHPLKIREQLQGWRRFPPSINHICWHYQSRQGIVVGIPGGSSFNSRPHIASRPTEVDWSLPSSVEWRNLFEEETVRSYIETSGVDRRRVETLLIDMSNEFVVQNSSNRFDVSPGNFGVQTHLFRFMISWVVDLVALFSVLQRSALTWKPLCPGTLLTRPSTAPVTVRSLTATGAASKDRPRLTCLLCKLDSISDGSAEWQNGADRVQNWSERVRKVQCLMITKIYHNQWCVIQR